MDPAPVRASHQDRAQALKSNRQLSTAFVQTMVFPFHAAYQRVFGRVRWHGPAVPVPAEADDIMLWAHRSGGIAPV